MEETIVSSISVIMPCHNRAYCLEKTLRAYNRQEGAPPFEVIAIDDGSTDGTGEVLAGFQPVGYRLQVHRFDRNQGPAAARNTGISLATSPYLLFVGDDILPAPDCIRQHLDAHTRRPATEVAILGHVDWSPDLPLNTLMAHITGPGAQQFSYAHFVDGEAYDFRHFYTANVSVKARLLRSVKPWFDTRFPYAAMEDTEFGYRLSKAGLRIVYHANARGYHSHYHTIWTFARRQYQAGYMLCHLTSKHPEAAGHFPMWNLLQKSRKRKVLVYGLVQCLLRSGATRAETAVFLEEYALLLASFYEWTPHPLLDDWYGVVLKYFWLKGMLHRMYRGSPIKSGVQQAFTVFYLRHHLRTILLEAKRHQIPTPFDQRILERRVSPLILDALELEMATW